MFMSAVAGLLHVLLQARMNRAGRRMHLRGMERTTRVYGWQVRRRAGVAHAVRGSGRRMVGTTAHGMVGHSGSGMVTRRMREFGMLRMPPVCAGHRRMEVARNAAAGMLIDATVVRAEMTPVINRTAVRKVGAVVVIDPSAMPVWGPRVPAPAIMRKESDGYRGRKTDRYAGPP